MKANYHTHVKLCGHAVGMCEDYVVKAIEYGYNSLGMSDHGPILPSMMTPEEFSYNWLDRQMDYQEFKTVYLKDINECKKKYSDKINIYAGLEIEYLPNFHDYFVQLKQDLDYMNLGPHFFIHNDVITNSFDDVTNENVYSYAKTVVSAIESGLYSIVVHPDVFMHHYRDVNGENKWDEECSKTARLIIEAAVINDVYLEVNCGGLFKVSAAKEVVGKFGYPRDEFWSIASEYPNLKVVIGVDAHDPIQLNAKEIKQAKEFAVKHNIKVDEYCLNIEKN